MSRQRAAAIVNEAAELASERLGKRGLPELPNTSHTLRRTYISIALLANRFEVLWVMSQVGHADSKMTMDVYAQLQQRVDRQHGRAFDALVRQARGRLYGADDASDRPFSGGEIGGGLNVAHSDEPEALSPNKEKALVAGPFGVARPGLEPGTPQFSDRPAMLSNRCESPAHTRDRARPLSTAEVRKFRQFPADSGNGVPATAQ